jgi:RNA recognition motif-containing protein
VILKLFFRIICDKDKDTGKTRVYAVCEYKDQETAINAVKTLSAIEIAGRFMKVDHALNEKSRLEMICMFGMD